MAENNEKPEETTDSPAETAGTPTASGAPAPPVVVPKRTAAFRKELLAKLPILGYEDKPVKDSFRLDDEWNSIVNVKADAVLEPLEPLAPNR